MNVPFRFASRIAAFCAAIVFLWGCSSSHDRFYTPLDLAVRENKVDKAALLLERGADVNKQAIHRGHKMPSPLMWAAGRHTDRGDPYEMVKLLLDHGADVNAKMELGITPLYDAAHSGHWARVLTLLVSKGADIGAQTFDGSTALHGAAGTGWYEGVRILLESGADPLVKDKSGRTPLNCAEERVRSLLGGTGTQRPVEVKETRHLIEILKQYEQKRSDRESRSGEK
jgi:ankyrin repeat protein